LRPLLLYRSAAENALGRATGRGSRDDGSAIPRPCSPAATVARAAGRPVTPAEGFGGITAKRASLCVRRRAVDNGRHVHIGIIRKVHRLVQRAPDRLKAELQTHDRRDDGVRVAEPEEVQEKNEETAKA